MRVLGWMVVVLFALAACGDDDDGTTDTPDAQAGSGGTGGQAGRGGTGGGGTGGGGKGGAGAGGADAGDDAGTLDGAVDAGPQDGGHDAATEDAGSGECAGADDGTPCGSATATTCTAADTCMAGVCQANHLNEGGACGDPTANACTAADSCAAGVCQANHLNEGGACGDPTANACTAADSCAAGVCLPNHLNEGGACGDPTADACTTADSCTAGTCVPNNINEGGACGDPTADACTTADSCVAGACAPNNINEGGACGDPTADACNAADSCLAGACVPNNINEGGACGDPTTTACTTPDSCVAGTCVANHINEGGPCGDTTTTECSAPDNCVAGVCQANHASNTTSCGATTATDCDPIDKCDGSGACPALHTTAGTACYDCPLGGGFCGACASGTCPDAAACTAVASPALDTPIVNNNGQDGNMFDVTATTGVVITGFEGNIANTPNAQTEYYIYMKRGSLVGFENNSAAWTLVRGPFALTPNVPNTLTPIVSDLAIAIPAGETYAFYLSNTSAVSNNNRYHNGTATGTVLASDSHITVYEGTGGAYPFGTFFNARPWEGRVIYRQALAPKPTGMVASDGIVFDVLATDTVVVDALNVHLAAGTFPLEIYFRRGTHVGAETNAALWTLLGSQADLVSSGPAEYTAVPFAASVQLEAGETGAFYVNTGTASSGVLSRAGVNVGDEVLDDGNAVIVAGNAISGVFGTVGAVSIAEAMLAYDVCGP